VKPLPPAMKALYEIASQQVGKLEGAKTLFKEQRYQDALTNLDSLEQQDPQNQSIKRLITDAHFNLGAVALQEERLSDAAREFDEVLKKDPSDELARRSKALAERYNGQPKDLLYKIYVKYLPTRKVSDLAPVAPPSAPAAVQQASMNSSGAAAAIDPLKGCPEYIARLETCTPYQCTFTHPLTGEPMQRRIIELKNRCRTAEEWIARTRSRFGRQSQNYTGISRPRALPENLSVFMLRFREDRARPNRRSTEKKS